MARALIDQCAQQIIQEHNICELHTRIGRGWGWTFRYRYIIVAIIFSSCTNGWRWAKRKRNVVLIPSSFSLLCMSYEATNILPSSSELSSATGRAGARGAVASGGNSWGKRATNAAINLRSLPVCRSEVLTPLNIWHPRRRHTIRIHDGVVVDGTLRMERQAIGPKETPRHISRSSLGVGRLSLPRRPSKRH